MIIFERNEFEPELLFYFVYMQIVMLIAGCKPRLVYAEKPRNPLMKYSLMLDYLKNGMIHESDPPDYVHRNERVYQCLSSNK
jgi:hypothetical protein